MKKVKVVGQSKEDNGNIIGTYDSNPMLNTMVYDAKFPDGTIRKYRANVESEKCIPKLILRVFCTTSSLESLTLSNIPLSSRKLTNIS